MLYGGLALSDREYIRDNPFDGRVGFLSSPVHPIVIWTIVINVVVFLLQNFGVAYDEGLGSRPQGPKGGLAWNDLLSGEYWRLVTYAFVHAHFAHLAMNMVFLVYFCGQVVADRLGPVHFAAIYLLGAFVGALANVYVDQTAYLVGASAAGFALLFAFATVDPDRSILVFFFYRLRIVTLARALVIISVVFFLLDQMRDPEAGGLRVAQLAHLGGALVGWLYVHALNRGAKPFTTATLQKERRRRESRDEESFAAGKAESGAEEKETKKELDVDAILDKINDKGFESLTRKERQALEAASKTTPGGGE